MSKKKFDKTKLNLVHIGAEEWVPAEKLGLPPGIEYRIFRLDEEAGEMDLMVRYQPNYYEPRHTHEAEHWQVIIEGEMHVAGEVMGPGDYVFGPANEPHGPFWFPNGMLSFASSRGGSIFHVYDVNQAEVDAKAAREAARKGGKE
jgi:hypothetical protein